MENFLNLIIPIIILASGVVFTKRMIELSSEQRLYLAFFSISSLIIGCWVILAAETYARCSVDFYTISAASKESIDEIFKYPMATIFKLFPYSIIGAITAESSKDGKIRQGCSMMVCGFIPVTYWYVTGSLGTQHALLKHAWTAAALSSGLSVFYSIPFSLGGLFVGKILSGFFDKPKT